MRKSTLSVFILILSILAPWVAVAEARPATPNLLIGTAQLDRHRLVVRSEKKHPKSVFAYGACVKVSRSHVDCKYTETRTAEGISEITTYTMHDKISYTSTGTIRNISTTYTGPVEA